MDYLNKENNKRLKEPLVKVKKQFVSEIQRRLDPRKDLKEFSQAMRQE